MHFAPLQVVLVEDGHEPVWESGANRVLHVPMPTQSDGPGRMVLMLHQANPSLMITVYEQACRGEWRSGGLL